jgi:hypothetical protein
MMQVCARAPTYRARRLTMSGDNAASNGSGTPERGNEASFHPQVFEIPETASNRFQLSLGTLCQVHKLLINGSTAIGGKVRDGPAVSASTDAPPTRCRLRAPPPAISGG